MKPVMEHVPDGSYETIKVDERVEGVHLADTTASSGLLPKVDDESGAKSGGITGGVFDEVQWKFF